MLTNERKLDFQNTENDILTFSEIKIWITVNTHVSFKENNIGVQLTCKFKHESQLEEQVSAVHT